jgi:hypothetical protein
MNSKLPLRSVNGRAGGNSQKQGCLWPDKNNQTSELAGNGHQYYFMTPIIDSLTIGFISPVIDWPIALKNWQSVVVVY